MKYAEFRQRRARAKAASDARATFAAGCQMPDTPARSIAEPPRRKTSRRLGFSLTELLVVIAIIAVLLAILFTVVHAAIQAVRAFKTG
jgi:prepilin-type N-terminal cleavage/methylation domain-containing protein